MTPDDDERSAGFTPPAAVGWLSGDDGAEAEFRRLVRVLERAAEAGLVEEHRHPDRTATLTVTDASGARLVMHADRRGEVGCVKASFGTGHVLAWHPTDVEADPGCPFCSLVHAEIRDDDGDVITIVGVGMDAIGTVRARARESRAGHVSALCAGGRVWRDEQDYADEHAGEEGPSLAVPGLIPTGLFGPDGPSTGDVALAARVIEARHLRNELGGGDFTVVTVASLIGPLDLCAAPGTLEDDGLLAPGAVVACDALLVGRPADLRPDDEAPRRRRGLFRRG